MANKVAIVTDSTASIPSEWLSEFNITVVPLSVIWGDEVILDGVDISPKEFFERLTQEKTMPSTSQPTPAAFKKIYEELTAKGFDILSIHISTGLSGTINSANQAKEMVTKANVEIIDTLSTSIGTGWPVLMVARAAKAGKSLAECKVIAETAIKETHLYLCVDTLEFFHRGGRIGGASRYLGTALSLKPLLEVTEEGKIDGVEKIRTSKKAHKRMVELVLEKIGDRRPLYLSILHADAEEEAKKVLEMISTVVEPKEVLITWVSPVIGVHTGPGTVGVAFMAGID